MRRAGIVAMVVVACAAALVPVVAGGPRAAAAASSGYQATIDNAVADIQAWWSDTFPDLYGSKFVPVPASRIIPGRPGVELPACGGDKESYRDVKGNAFYCSGGNFVAYDDAGLFPDLYKNLGGFSVALVLAHEWGHAVQDRADEVDHATIYKELQADCFAGAWTAHVSNDKTRVAFAPGDLELALAALINFRDVPGSTPDDPSAHGSAFDRVGAFQDGFEFGVEKCAGYFQTPPLVVQIPFRDATDAQQQGDVPASDVIPLAVELLNDFYSQVEPKYTPLSVDDVYEFDSTKRSTIQRCGNARPSVAKVKNRVYYCIDDNYVAFDQPFLQRIYDQIGDFGVVTLLANPWATRVQTIQRIPGASDNTLEAVLQADCYSGGFAAAFFNGVLSEGSLSAGDLDESVEAFLVYSRSRGVSAKVPISFVRVRFFREGFLSGYQSCGYSDIVQQVAALR